MKLFYLPVLPLEHAHIKKKQTKQHLLAVIMLTGFSTKDSGQQIKLSSYRTSVVLRHESSPTDSTWNSDAP